VDKELAGRIEWGLYCVNAVVASFTLRTIYPCEPSGTPAGGHVGVRRLAQLVAGTVRVNSHGMVAQDPRLPFGGVGQSALGRELGADGIRAFTQLWAFVRHPAPQ
jgi:Aldehyde dehydrogenase family